jgi:hypothetical protein
MFPVTGLSFEMKEHNSLLRKQCPDFLLDFQKSKRAPRHDQKSNKNTPEPEQQTTGCTFAPPRETPRNAPPDLLTSLYTYTYYYYLFSADSAVK